ncbi:Uncharacterized protein TCM_005595 [Theobroma cacao]|uniref:Uncharacterized protein n=1 Tax=Theobroma cacao TaxID=3641 RepID=A0A061DW85_THECC|nr:Uncharacterized protein TCM_005595 [Theobroma cacao]
MGNDDSTNHHSQSSLFFPIDRENEEELNCCIKFHAVIVFFVSTSCTLLQTKYQGRDQTPFNTHYCHMLAFFVNLCIYVVALVSEMNLPATSTSSRLILNAISQFSGALASVMLLLILVPLIGWLTFALWIVCFVRIIKKCYPQFVRWFNHVKFDMFEIWRSVLSRHVTEEENS